MKKIIMILVLLISMTSLSYGELNYVGNFNETPLALRGEWVGIEGSIDEGKSWVKNRTTLFNVTNKIMRTSVKTFNIIKIEQYEEGGHILYVFKTNDPSIIFCLEFTSVEDSEPLFQCYNDGKEILRSIIEIK